MAELRIAIIGYGLAGRVFHAPLIARTAGLTVAAILTRDPGRRALAAREHPGAVLMADAGEVWAARDALDAVIIAAPNEVHVPLAMAAVDHGLPVVVDKPLAVDADAAERLCAHAERRGVVLTVFQNRRWDSDQLLLAELIAGGALGAVTRYESRLERWLPVPAPGAWRESLPPAAGGGLLLDLGSHLVDQALHHFGAAREVYAEIDSRRGRPGDDDAFLAIRHAGGVVSHLHASAVVAAPGPRLRVLGTEAALVVSAPDIQEERLRAGGGPHRVEDSGPVLGEPAPNRPRLIAGERSVPLTGPPGDWPAFYTRWRDALRSGGPPPVDPRDAVAVLRVLDGARVSAAQRTVVRLG